MIVSPQSQLNSYKPLQFGAKFRFYLPRTILPTLKPALFQDVSVLNGKIATRPDGQKDPYAPWCEIKNDLLIVHTKSKVPAHRMENNHYHLELLMRVAQWLDEKIDPIIGSFFGDARAEVTAHWNKITAEGRGWSKTQFMQRDATAPKRELQHSPQHISEILEGKHAVHPDQRALATAIQLDPSETGIEKKPAA